MTVRAESLVDKGGGGAVFGGRRRDESRSG
jgi:3'-phosphoadenosine 5'-phosphosulfate sulfotransferase (PAPS reductase)/FAD synthetase